MMRLVFLIFLLLPLQAFAQCMPEDLFSGKATVEIPKPKGFFGSTPKPSPELIEEAKSLAKLNALNNYVTKCLRDDRTKMDRYLSVADKIKSKIDLIVSIEREKQKQNDEEKTLTVRVRASVNSTAFDSVVIGQNKSAKSSGSSGKKLRMVSFFIARKADATDTKNFDDKRSKITKKEAGVTAEKSLATDGTTTSMNKEASSYTKTKTGGSTEKKQRSSKRNWTIVSPKDLDATVQKVLTDNGLKGGKYSYFAKKCGAPPMDLINEEFSINDTMSDDTEASIFDAILDSDARYCIKRTHVVIGTVSYNTALISKVTGKPTVSGSVRLTVTQISEDDGPEVIASVGPINIRATGLEDNDAEKNALIMAGKKAGQAIVDTLKSNGY